MKKTIVETEARLIPLIYIYMTIPDFNKEQYG